MDEAASPGELGVPMAKDMVKKMKSPHQWQLTRAIQHNILKIGTIMKNNITREYFKLIKGCVERKLDARHWRWSPTDSLLLDWCVWNVEATDDH